MQTEIFFDKRAFNKEIRLIISLICLRVSQGRDAEDNTEITATGGINWELFHKIVFYQGVADIMYVSTPDFYGDIMPESVFNLFKKQYYTAILRNKILLKEFINVVKGFDKNGIKFIPFKGIIFNNLIYPSGFVRDMQDVDIMIQRKQLQEVNDVLVGYGYSAARDIKRLDNKDNFIEFVRDDAAKENRFILDVQWGTEVSCGDANKNGLSGLWQKTRETHLCGLKMSCLSPEDMLFNLFFHQRRFGMPFTLRSILDIAFVVERYKEEIDWDFILREAMLNRISNLTFFCLAAAGELFGCSCPSWVLQKIRPGFLRKKLFNYFFIKTLNHICQENVKEMASPYFVFISALLYDKIIDLLIYINNISYHQFNRFCGFKNKGLIVKLLFGVKFLFLPVFLFFKCMRLKLKTCALT